MNFYDDYYYCQIFHFVNYNIDKIFYLKFFNGIIKFKVIINIKIFNNYSIYSNNQYIFSYILYIFFKKLILNFWFVK